MEYAKNPLDFIKNSNKILDYHYNGIGVPLQAINLKQTSVSLSTCNPKVVKF